ncbi:MAG: protein translocase subunit SecF [Dehalococcoidales bacterium]|nr:protein translocase subunit SecF [Dehalococcoidales bacterium]
MNIIGRRFGFFLISIVIILLGIISLIIFGLPMGIEFSSGSLLTIDFEQQVEQQQLTSELIAIGYEDVLIQQTGAGDFLIRTHELSGEDRAALEGALAAKFGNLTEAEFNSVSPMVATETAKNAIIAMVVASGGILLYLTYAFRRMPKPFRYGTCAVIALLHDSLVALGMFSILGSIMNWQVNLMFIIGILTVIGYSVNNMVVIFDRIRENQQRGISPDFETVVNNSIVETLSRSLNTSFTTLITVLALLLFVGATIQNFVIVVMIGIIAGTFDSICVAPALLVVWEKKEWGKFIRYVPFARAKA